MNNYKKIHSSQGTKPESRNVKMNIPPFALTMISVTLLMSILSFAPSAVSAQIVGPVAASDKLVIAFYNTAAIPTNSVSSGELSVCVDGQAMAPIELNKYKSMSVNDTGLTGEYNVSVYYDVISAIDGSVTDPCTLGTSSLLWSGTAMKPAVPTLGLVINVGGTIGAPNVTQSEITHNLTIFPDNTDIRGQWVADGQGLSAVSTQFFDSSFYQAVRGTDNNIYTRKSTGPSQWSEWLPNGQTLDEVAMETFFGSLYQAVRGTDGLIYTRSTTDGTMWTPWVANGATLGKVSMVRNGATLVQAVRGTDNNIYTRAKSPTTDWSVWQADGQTRNDIAIVSYNNAVYQSVVGTDQLVYVRHNTTPFLTTTWTEWLPARDENNAVIRSASTSVELTVSNNNLIVATTNAQSYPILATLTNPLVNAQTSVITDLTNKAKYNSFVQTEGINGAGNPAYLSSTSLQIITNPDNGNISYRYAYGSNVEINNWKSGWIINGATKYKPNIFSHQGRIIWSVIGTDGNIYT